MEAALTLIALLAALALAIAAASLFRLSRARPPPPDEVAERTFATLAAGDVVVTPHGDFLVESRAALEGQGPLFALRSGREARWLWAPPEGPLGFFAAEPKSAQEAKEAAREPGARLERPTVDLLPGT
jgi:hypothetical protein